MFTNYFFCFPIGITHHVLHKAGCISGWLSEFILIQIFLFSDNVCDISKLYNFLTMHVAYLSIQFSDKACDISVNPFYANELDIRFDFISKQYIRHTSKNIIPEKYAWFKITLQSFALDM